MEVPRIKVVTEEVRGGGDTMLTYGFRPTQMHPCFVPLELQPLGTKATQ